MTLAHLRAMWRFHHARVHREETNVGVIALMLANRFRDPDKTGPYSISDFVPPNPMEAAPEAKLIIQPVEEQIGNLMTFSAVYMAAKRGPHGR